MANLLLIVSGGIAAYKACEFIRLAKKAGHSVTPILTKGGAQFITPLTLSALAESPVYEDLFSLKDESEMGHIRLSREADLIVVAPASANMIAKMAQGFSDDLASTVLLASDKPVLIAPAMNPMMWQHAATQDNLKILAARGIHRIGPDDGDMACGETGSGRLADPAAILDKAEELLGHTQSLKGLHAIVTSGPTYEPLDPVRFIGNRSSGKQGHAIAQALREAGARVTLVSGPVALPDPSGVTTMHIETAAQMDEAVQNALPADIFIGAAAVADWSATPLIEKHKKTSDTWDLSLGQTVDILAKVAQLPRERRPKLVIGFALETHNIGQNAATKLTRKGADALLVNQASSDNSPFGADVNRLGWLDASDLTNWGMANKKDHAQRLASTISSLMKG